MSLLGLLFFAGLVFLVAGSGLAILDWWRDL